MAAQWPAAATMRQWRQQRRVTCSSLWRRHGEHRLLYQRILTQQDVGQEAASTEAGAGLQTMQRAACRCRRPGLMRWRVPFLVTEAFLLVRLCHSQLAAQQLIRSLPAPCNGPLFQLKLLPDF